MKKFNMRATVSFLVTLSFIIVLITGIGLYISPSGRIAREASWNLIGVNKWKLESLHDVFGYFLAILVILHLYFNWKIFLSYLRKKLVLKRELVIAIIIMLIILFGTLKGIFPFSLI